VVTEPLLVVASGLNGSNRRPSDLSAALSCLESGLERVGAAARGADEPSAKPTAHTPNTNRFIISLPGKHVPASPSLLHRSRDCRARAPVETLRDLGKQIYDWD